MLCATCIRLAACLLDGKRGAKSCEAGDTDEPLDVVVSPAHEAILDREQFKPSVHCYNSSSQSAQAPSREHVPVMILNIKHKPGAEQVLFATAQFVVQLPHQTGTA